MNKLAVMLSLVCLALAAGCPDGYAGSPVDTSESDGGLNDVHNVSDTTTRGDGSDTRPTPPDDASADGRQIDSSGTQTPDGGVSVIRRDWEASVGSVSRDVHVVRPETLTSAPTVWVFLHGCLQTGSDFAASMDAESLVRKRGVIALFPTQDRGINPQGCWRWYSQSERRATDAEPAFVAGLVDIVANRLDVTVGEAYLTGFSAGGGLASLVAGCAPNTFDGVVIHSGLEFAAADSAFEAPAVMTDPTQARDPDDAGRLAFECGSAGTKDPPLLIIHGRDDSTVNAGHAERTARQWLQTRDLRDDGRDNDSVNWIYSESTDTTIAGREVTQRTFDDTPLKMMLIGGMDHAYAGGSGTNGDPGAPDATDRAWQFFTSPR